MNESINVLRKQLGFRIRFLKEQEETIRVKKGHIVQLETEKNAILIEIADMERAISFLERVQ